MTEKKKTQRKNRRYTESDWLEAERLFLLGWSYQDISKKLDMNSGRLSVVGNKKGWQKRRMEIQAQASMAVQTEVLDTLTNLEKEHIEAYHDVRKKGQDALPKVDVRTAHEAASLVDIGARGEKDTSKGMLEREFVMIVLSVLKNIIPEEYHEEVRNQLGLVLLKRSEK